jgi:hypothetical protein
MRILNERMGGLGLIALGVTALSLTMAAVPPAMATTKGPDAGGYTATDATVYSFINLAGGSGASSVLANTDDGVALVTLPFPFVFYGTSYNMICASVNGLVTFVTSAAGCTTSNDFANTDLTQTGPPGAGSTPGDPPAILPYWMDLSFQVPGAGALYYQSQGDSGSHKFILQWNNAYPTASPNPVTFEVILYEGSNQILFQYGTVNLGTGNAASNGKLATIGIRNSNGIATGRQIQWSYDAAVLDNSTAILFAPPATSQTSVNTITTNIPGMQVTVDGTAYAAPKQVVWTPGTQHTLAVVAQQVSGGTQELFTAWNQGGTTASVTVTAQTTGTTYTATFKTQYQLTTGVNPVGSGTLTGAGWYDSGSVVSVQANAAANYVLSSFSGDASGTTNPMSVTMNAPKNVVGNFRSTATPKLVANITATGAVDSIHRVWTLQLKNQGLGLASAAQITGLTLTQVIGTPCSPAPTITSSLPVVLGDIAAGANTSGQVQLNFAGCQGAVRFTVVVKFSANSGAYTGSTTIGNQVE